jgi:hypothetical protein
MSVSTGLGTYDRLELEAIVGRRLRLSGLSTAKAIAVRSPRSEFQQLHNDAAAFVEGAAALDRLEIARSRLLDIHHVTSAPSKV